VSLIAWTWFQRYGPATSCVAVAGRAGVAPRVVLDAGTGFMNLGRLLGDRPFEGTVLLSHLHWDHTHGLPFLRQAGLPGHRVDVLVPGQEGDALEVVDRAFSPPHFPVPFSMLGERWSLAGIEPGTHELDGVTVVAREVPHKGSRTFGSRVSDGSATVLPARPPAAGAGAGNPWRTDDEIDAIVTAAARDAAVPFFAARAGAAVTLPGPPLPAPGPPPLPRSPAGRL
jgi:hypothetical protein